MYRHLEHGNFPAVVNNHRRELQAFPQDVQDFAHHLVNLQIKRHKADYDPLPHFYKSAVLADIDHAEYLMDRMDAVNRKDRTAFLVLLLFKQRKT